MRIEKEDRALIVHLESGDSLLNLKDEILDSAQKDNAYAIAFVITEEWKFDLNEADNIYAWMKEILFITMIAIQGEPSDSNKAFTLFGEYRLTRVDYTIDVSKFKAIDLRDRCKLLYGEQMNTDESIEIQANVEEENICDAIIRKGKDWFQGKSSEHIRKIISFYKNFNKDISEEKLLNLESHTFCNLVNGEQVNV